MNIANKKMTDDFYFDPFGTQDSATVSQPVPKAAGRFQKMGKNALHPLTVDMRRIKTDLGYTTRQLVNELKEYESKFGFAENDQHGVSRDFIPMNSVLMSSYLQGWVLQSSYMEAVHARLTKFYAHKALDVHFSPKSITKRNIRALFDKWFDELGIADMSNRANGAPMRTFAKIIAPYYKRPVTTKFDGVFTLGESYSTLEQAYTITDNLDISHSFVLNRAEKVFFKSGDYLKRSDIIQYSVLYPLVLKPDGKHYFDINSPSADHTAFFRWYTSNKAPRSIKTLDFVAEAVDMAKLALATN